ncbi:hypothetical protein [Longispora urticae]
MTLVGEAAQRTVTFAGKQYPAEELARGAAYELYLDGPEPGALPNPRPGARHPFRMFVHSSEVPGAEPFDAPLTVPLSRTMSWESVQRLSQTPGGDLRAVRESATIKSGTRMIKPLSATQVGAYLRRGALPHGCCYREHDIAHLRTPADLRFLGIDDEDAAYALRWRAIGPEDYEIADLPGVMALPPHERVGPPLLGTGFAPSNKHLVPEFVTADLAELPLPAFSELIAYLPDGTEVTLFHFVPEQKAWSRMAGPQWRRLLTPIDADQEMIPVPDTFARLVGSYQGEVKEAVADPPGEFRLLAKNRAARYPVESLARRDVRGRWRGIDVLIVGADKDWLRVRLIRPDSDSIVRIGARSTERCVYEAWAQGSELSDVREHQTPYRLSW